MADQKLSAVSTEATPSVGDERLYGVQDLAGSPTSVYHKLGDVMYYGAAAPSSPEDNFLWHETDTGIIWRYGTYASASRWVSVATYSLVAGQSTNASSAAFVFLTGFQPGYDIYIDTLYLKHHTITTNSGSHYWVVTLRKLTGATVPAAGAGTSIAAINTSASSPDTWTYVTPVSVDAVLDNVTTGFETPFWDVSKSGSPGNIWSNFGVTYRLIHP